MEFVARHRYARVSPKKAKLVADLIRGKSASEALRILQFSDKRAAAFLHKVLSSAIANAGTSSTSENLRVSDARVDRGPTMKRWRPGPRGMVRPILKRTSHITIKVSD
jgi:large subunit ribosomal protein L22